jgi:hypothetical protein
MFVSNAHPIARVANVTWRKSSRSNQGGEGGNCVEVAFAGSAIAVRDSKSPDTGTLVLPAASWSGLLARLVSVAAG